MMEFVFHGYRRLLLRFLWRSANVSSSKLHLVRRLYSRVAICTDAFVFFLFFLQNVYNNFGNFLDTNLYKFSVMFYEDFYYI